jgi:ligand-binding sensor domain-containing protein
MDGTRCAWRWLHYLRLAKRLILATAWIWVIGSSTVQALDPGRRISQYGHAAWRVRDGTPPSAPWGIAQTTDGYLWIGTPFGLMHFDGVRFAPWQPANGPRLPSPEILLLRAAKDGSLWISSRAGLSRLQSGVLKNYPIDAGYVSALLEDANGDMWVSLDGPNTTPRYGPHRACRVLDSTLECHGPKDGLADSPAAECCNIALAQDATGDFWFGNDTELTRWRPGVSSEAFAPAALRHNQRLSGIYDLQPERDGSVWVGMGISGHEGGLQHFTKGTWEPFVVKGFDSSRLVVQGLLLDSHGALWIGTLNEGLYRIHDGAVDHFGASDGLTSDLVIRVFEDREGSIWVTTSHGVDQLRDIRIVTLTTHEGLSADEVDSVLARRDGSLCVGTSAGLDVLTSQGLSSIHELTHHQVTSMLEDHSGRLWVGTETEMMVYESGRFTSVRYPDGSDLGLVTDMVEDAAHDVWLEVSGEPRKLLHVRDRKLLQVLQLPQVPEARKLAADPGGGLWLGLTNGDLAHYRDGRVETYSYQSEHASRLPSAWVNQIDVLADGSVMAATGYGLIGWRNGGKRTLTARNGMPCAVFAFAFDTNGDLWLDASCGYVRIGASALAKWWQSDTPNVPLQTFDAFDGAQSSWIPFRGSARLPDGRLYFATGGGLQIIDPSHLLYNRIPPPVQMEEVVADHRHYPPRSPLHLPPLTRDLELDYTALSFVLPQKLSFRYRLEGHDREWISSGNRRQAFYTDLSPGAYRFRVVASNNDGLWNEAGATLDLSIAPMFYQTWWFALLSVLATAGLVLLLVLWRIQYIKTHLRGRLEERLVERERIARELHDTFLQSVHGLVLQFQSAMEKIPYGEPARKAMEQALDRADGVLAEGRERVANLRTSVGPRDDLPRALQLTGEQHAALSDVVFRFTVEGTQRAVHPVAGGEVEQICREALTNAFRHAGAQHVDLDLSYSHSGLTARIVDDGRGFDAQTLDHSPERQHFGLVGMRERARKIRARLELSSRPGAGTSVELHVPASVAFAPTARRARA